MTNSKSIRQITIALVVSTGGAFTWTHADSETENYTEELALVRAQVHQLQASEAAVRRQLLDAENKRQNIADQLSALTEQEQHLEQKLSEQSPQFRDLVKRRNELRLQLRRKSAALQSIVRGSIITSRIDLVKVLFSPNEPKQLLRALRYYRHLTRLQAQETRAAYQMMRELDQTESQLLASNGPIARLNKNRRQLRQSHTQLAATVVSLRQRIAGHQSALDDRAAEEKRLLNLLVE